MRKPFKEYEIFETIRRHLGVSYVYEEIDRGLRTTASAEKLSDDFLAGAAHALPEELIAKLREATELSDAALIEQLIEDVKTENDRLAEALAELANNFAYDEILALIGGSGERP